MPGVDAPPVPKALLGLTVASGVLTIAIHWQCFPPLLQEPLRAYGLHVFAVLATSIATGLALGGHQDPQHAARRLTLACLVPYGLLAAHELMQWLYPEGPPEDVDLGRDLAMNAVGTFAAWWALAVLPRRASRRTPRVGQRGT